MSATAEVTRLWRWEQGATVRRDSDRLACEEPLEIRLEAQPLSVLLRTPGHDEELVAGFLFSEGIIRRREDLLRIAPYPRNPRGNVIDVFLAPGVPVDYQRLTRHVLVASSCGLCGATTIAAVHRHFKPIRSGLTVSAAVLLHLPDRLFETQATFRETGGLHAAAVFTREGDLVVLREDIGRHNAVDKVLGHAMLHGLLPFERHVLCVSGRASFEILQKALAARTPVVAALSAPSSLAVRFARASGQTLVGFLRAGRLNAYSGRQRIRFGRNQRGTRCH